MARKDNFLKAKANWLKEGRNKVSKMVFLLQKLSELYKLAENINNRSDLGLE